MRVCTVWRKNWVGFTRICLVHAWSHLDRLTRTQYQWLRAEDLECRREWVSFLLYACTWVMSVLPVQKQTKPLHWTCRVILRLESGIKRLASAWHPESILRLEVRTVLWVVMCCPPDEHPHVIEMQGIPRWNTCSPSLKHTVGRENWWGRQVRNPFCVKAGCLLYLPSLVLMCLVPQDQSVTGASD